MSVIFGDISDLTVLDFDRNLFSPLLADIGWPNPAPWSYETSLTLALGVVGNAYEQFIDVTAWASPTSYDVSAGALPDGLSIAYVSGNKSRIYGTPTTSGTFSFTLHAVNVDAEGWMNFEIVILASLSGGSIEQWGILS